jgi:cytochrome c
MRGMRGMRRIARPLRAALTVLAAFHASQAWSVDAARGQTLYESRCGACHSLDANRVGPAHRGVVGRKAGSVADYDYSAAVGRSTLVWNAQTLDRWLTNPEALIPGQKMSYSVADAADRADIITYLMREAR